MEIKIIVCSIIVTVENKNYPFYADGRTSAYYKNLKELTLMAFHNRMSALTTKYTITILTQFIIIARSLRITLCKTRLQQYRYSTTIRWTLA